MLLLASRYQKRGGAKRKQLHNLLSGITENLLLLLVLQTEKVFLF
jgi:hypothetical protein